MSISLVLFALVAVLLYITVVSYVDSGWAILAGIALAGTGIGAFTDFHRHTRR